MQATKHYVIIEQTPVRFCLIITKFLIFQLFRISIYVEEIRNVVWM